MVSLETSSKSYAAERSPSRRRNQIIRRHRPGEDSVAGTSRTSPHGPLGFEGIAARIETSLDTGRSPGCYGVPSTCARRPVALGIMSVAIIQCSTSRIRTGRGSAFARRDQASTNRMSISSLENGRRSGSRWVANGHSSIITATTSRRPSDRRGERQGVRQTREGVESGFHTRDIGGRIPNLGLLDVFAGG